MLRIALFIISIVGSFYIVFQMIMPGIEENTTKQVELDEVEKQYEALQKRVANYEGIAETFRQQSQSVEAGKMYLPETGNEDKILNIMAQSAQSTGMYVNIFSMEATEDALTEPVIVENSLMEGGESVESGPANELRRKSILIAFDGVGSYESIKQFLRNMTQFEQGAELVSVSITPIQEENGEEGEVVAGDTLRAQMQIDFPYARMSLAEQSTILADFEDRKVSILSVVEQRGTLFPPGGLQDLEFQSGGRSNPFLPEG